MSLQEHLNVMSPTERAVKYQIDALLVAWNQGNGGGGDRSKHRHLSTLIQPFFCYRRDVMSKFYRQYSPALEARMCGIFIHGWAIHELRQAQFEQELSEEERELWLRIADKEEQEALDVVADAARENMAERLKMKYRLLVGKVGKIALECEKSHYYEPWDTAFTPDAVCQIEIDGVLQPVVFEFKGYNSDAYRKICKLADPHEHKEFHKASVQGNLYVHMLRELGLYPGLETVAVLIENKDNQDFIIKLCPYDAPAVVPYQGMITLADKYLDHYLNSGSYPRRVCAKKTDEHARACPLADACFASPTERIVYLKKK
jgi:hypothetical protein